jgi:hypothetical protein
LGRPQERDNASYIKRIGTVEKKKNGGLGTGARTVVIAGLPPRGSRKEYLVASFDYAAAGPIVHRPPPSARPSASVGRDPDASAVSDE